MKVSERRIDDVNAIITVLVEKPDYQEEVDKSVQKIRQKANIPGFRPGKIPTGLIKKMYGKSILAEEINKLVSDNLLKYIRENNLNILGEPLPNQTEQKEIDFDTQEDFEFLFDVGLAPEITVNLSKKDDKINYYTIKVDDDLLDKQIKSYTNRYGTLQSVDEEALESDTEKGALTEPDAEGNINPEVTRFKEAELGQELFDKVFGAGVVTSEEEFKAKVKEDLEVQFLDDSDYKFMLDAKEYIMDKAGAITFPDAHLKRWLLVANEKHTAESIEQEYPEIIKNLTWQLICGKLANEYNIKVEEPDLLKAAQKVIKAQFAHYGLSYIPDSMLENYAKDLLDKKEKVRDLSNRVVEEKLIQAIKAAVTLKKKELTFDKFNKMFSDENVPVAKE